MLLSTTQSLMDFRKHDLLTRGSANRGCMAVFPQGKKSRQRVAVGDSTGSVLVFNVGKHHDIQPCFETPTAAKAVSRVTLYDDQLFYVYGSQVAAYSKKGKPFFGFDTNLTDNVRSFQVDTPYLFAGGEYIVTTFQETNEVGYFMAQDRINEILIYRHRKANPDQPSPKNYHIYLGCNDRVLRTLHENSIIAEVGCEAPISSLTYALDDRGRDVLYGTSAGTIGALRVTKSDELQRKYSLVPDTRLGAVTSITSTDINLDGTADVILAREDGSVEVHACSLHSDNAAPLRMWSTNVGEYVASVATGLITQVERDEVIINTFSGKVIAFALSADDVDIVHRGLPAVVGPAASRLADVPTVQEAVEAIKQGSPTAASATDATKQQPPQTVQTASPVTQKPSDATSSAVPVATPSALPSVPPPQEDIKKSSKKEKEKEKEKEKATSGIKVESGYAVTTSIVTTKPRDGPSTLEILAAQIKETKTEVERLRNMAETRRNEYTALVGASEASKARAVTSEFRLRDSFSLDGAAALIIAIEADVAIDSVGIHCDVPLEVLDSESMIITCPTLPTVANAPPEAQSSTSLQCLVRPSDERPNRVHMTFRSHEGQSGTIRAYVVAKPQPRTAQTRTFVVRPLSLHHRITESEAEWANLPLSSVSVTGQFTIRDVHGWLLNALPDVPDVLPADAVSNTLFFRNTFQGTVLSVRYRKGEAEFLSDSLSALTILKDSVTRDATTRKIPLRIQYQARRESIQRHLQLLHPLLSYQSSLVAKLKLVEALKEIESQEQDSGSFLSGEHKQILADAVTIEHEVKLQPKRMDYLKRIVKQLFTDKAAMMGDNYAGQKLAQLESILEHVPYDCDAVEMFFNVHSSQLPAAAAPDAQPSVLQAQ